AVVAERLAHRLVIRVVLALRVRGARRAIVGDAELACHARATHAACRRHGAVAGDARTVAALEAGAVGRGGGAVGAGLARHALHVVADLAHPAVFRHAAVARNARAAAAEGAWDCTAACRVIGAGPAGAGFGVEARSARVVEGAGRPHGARQRRGIARV